MTNKLSTLAVMLLASIFDQAFLAAQPMPVRSTPATDPTEFGSLRFDPSDAPVLEGGQWAVSFTTSYFNQFGGTWHTRRIHQNLERHRQPVLPEELRYIEEHFPNDEVFRVDVEGWRNDLTVARGFGNGMTLSLRVPWINIGSPNWDDVAEQVHAALPPYDSYGRDVFPRGSTFVYIKAGDTIVERRGELDGSGIGDTSLSLAIPFGGRLAQRAIFSVEAPTGEEGTLHGSGGWDFGARWSTSWRGKHRSYLVGAGYSWLDDGGSFLGLPRSDVWHLSLDADQPLGPNWTARFGARVDSSPLSGVLETYLGRPVIYYRLGLMTRLGERNWLSFDVGEEILGQIGVDADWSAHLTLSTIF